MPEPIFTPHLDSETIAKRIFTQLELNQSVTVYGWNQNNGIVRSIGEEVLKELNKLDFDTNWETRPGDGRRRRKRVKLENCIGEFTRSKCFRYKKETIDGNLRVTIWRIQ